MATRRKEPRKDSATGRYVYRFDVPTATGERRQRQVSGHTKAECYAKERQIVADAAVGQRPPDKQPLGAYLDYYLAHVVKDKRHTSTYKNYVNWSKHHIRPHLGMIPLGRLSTEDCQRWVTALQAADCAPKSIRNYATLLRAILHDAIRAGRIVRDSMDGVTLPKVEEGGKAIWTPEQSQRFLAAARDDPYHPAWLLGLMTGMRIGEVVALQWQDVDLDAGRIVVARSYHPANGKETLPKGGKAHVVRIDAGTVAELVAHRKAQAERRSLLAGDWRGTEPHVCTGALGARLDPGRLRRRTQQLCAAAGVPYIAFHGLRRSHTTRLLDAGLDVTLVARRVGHSNPATTRRYYWTVEEATDQRVADLVRGAVLGETAALADDESTGVG